MKTWFTSDQHFFHDNIIKLCNRPFRNTDEMNAEMVMRWNSVVGPNDHVLHLGDLFGGKDLQAKQALRSRLNGRIFLVPGNHDRPQQMLSDGIVDEVLPLIYEEDFTCSNGEKRRIVCCHYPLQEWGRFYRHAMHLHGHCHGNVPGQATLSRRIRRLDVSADCHRYTPLGVDDVVRLLDRLEL